MVTTEDFFGGAPSLSWSRQDANGEWVDVPELLNRPRGGRVIAVGKPEQMKDYQTGKPLWWNPPTDANPIGEPKLQVSITLRCDGSGSVPNTDERNPADPSDLGDRRLFASSKDMKDAIAAACRKIGLRGPAGLVQSGGELYLAWTGKRPNKTGKGKPARTWSAHAVPGTAPADAVFDQQAAAQPAAPQPTWANGPQAGQPVPVGAGPGAAPHPGPTAAEQAAQADPRYEAYQAWLAQQQQDTAPAAPAAPPTAPPASPFAAPAAAGPPAASAPPWQQPATTPAPAAPASPAATPPWQVGPEAPAPAAPPWQA
jgi:hypothetical protein